MIFFNFETNRNLSNSNNLVIYYIMSTTTYLIKINDPNMIKRVGDSIKFSTTYHQFNRYHIRDIEWSFGDGSKSTKMSPDHKYTSAGSKEVKCVINKKYKLSTRLQIENRVRGNTDLTKCRQIESLTVNDIRLSSPNETDSKFLPGASISERTLSVQINTDVPFAVGSKLYMRLVACIDQENVKTPITPEVRTIYDVTTVSNSHMIDFTGEQIPLPKGIIYLPNDVEVCQTISLLGGTVVKYVILLSTSRYEDTLSCAIPLIVLVHSNAICDIKCEKVALSDAQTEEYPVKIYCQDTDSFVYATVPHCVTHCQAPRPIIQYYEWTEPTRSRTNKSRSVTITTTTDKPCNNCN